MSGVGKCFVGQKRGKKVASSVRRSVSLSATDSRCRVRAKNMKFTLKLVKQIGKNRRQQFETSPLLGKKTFHVFLQRWWFFYYSTKCGKVHWPQRGGGGGRGKRREIRPQDIINNYVQRFRRKNKSGMGKKQPLREEGGTYPSFSSLTTGAFFSGHLFKYLHFELMRNTFPVCFT